MDFKDMSDRTQAEISELMANYAPVKNDFSKLKDSTQKEISELFFQNYQPPKDIIRFSARFEGLRIRTIKFSLLSHQRRMKEFFSQQGQEFQTNDREFTDQRSLDHTLLRDQSVTVHSKSLELEAHKSEHISSDKDILKKLEVNEKNYFQQQAANDRKLAQAVADLGARYTFKFY